MCSSAEHFIYANRSLLGNTILIKTNMAARTASQFMFWLMNFSALLERFLTLSSQKIQCICIFVSTKGLREIWPRSRWTGHYKIFLTSWYHVVTRLLLCEGFHKLQQWLLVFCSFDFDYLLWKNYNGSRVLVLETGTYDSWDALCIRNSSDII